MVFNLSVCKLDPGAGSLKMELEDEEFGDWTSNWSWGYSELDFAQRALIVA